MFTNAAGPYDESFNAVDDGFLDITPTLVGATFDETTAPAGSPSGRSLVIDRRTEGACRLEFGTNTGYIMWPGTDDYCYEAFLMFPNADDIQTQLVMGCYNTSVSNNNRVWQMAVINPGNIRIIQFNNTVISNTFSLGPVGGSTILQGEWNHYAICRDGNLMRAYINGTQIGTTSANTHAHTTSGQGTTFCIGAYDGSGTVAGTTNIMHIGGVRITKGHSRYPAGTSFTAPTTFTTKL
jgi:hypothetical protein